MTARIAGKYTRAQLRMAAPRSRSLAIEPIRGGVTLHWGGAGSRIVDHRSCVAIWRGWQAFHMGPDRGWVDIAYCVDEQTEILTDHGWVTYRDLHEGDSVLTLNHDTGMSEWGPVLEVCVFPALPREMISMESGTHSSLTTPNHRWPVERPHRRTGRERVHDEAGRFVESGRRRNEYVPAAGQDRLWVTSETFGYWDRVPIAADCADLPTQAKHSDAMVEAVAWFWTEGHIYRNRDGSPGPNVAITQSQVVNSANCARIRTALSQTFGPSVDRMPRVGRRTDGLPRWREYAKEDNTEFWLNADAGALLQSLAPGRVPSPQFLLSLTRAQLALFVETSMLADNSGPDSLAQKDKAAAEAFQFALTLAGYATSLHLRPPTSSCTSPMWEIRRKKRRTFQPYRLAGDGARVTYGGHVWCPRTPNQTWLARRRGTVYFTGNTMGFCQHGWVFPGRGYGVRTAAQGTTRGNDISYAFCHINEAGKPPTAGAVDAATWLVADARRVGGAGPGLWPHSFWHETTCPGDQWRARIKSLGRASAPAPAPKGEDMPTEQEIVTALLDTHMPVKDLGSDGKSLTLRYLASRTYQSATRSEAAVVDLTHQVADLRAQVARLLAGEGS